MNHWQAYVPVPGTRYRFIPYVYILDHIRNVSDDKYVRLAMKVIAADIYANSGRYNPLWSERISPKYDVGKLINDIGAAGDPLAKTFLSYTIMRLVEPKSLWSIYITIDGQPFIMSKDRRVVVPMTDGRIRGFLSHVDEGDFIPVCSVSDLRDYGRMASILGDRESPLVYAIVEKEMNDIAPNHTGVVTQMLKAGTDMMKVSQDKGIHPEALASLRMYANLYRAARAYDVILANIPPSMCRKELPLPPIPRNSMSFSPDINIFTQS